MDDPKTSEPIRELMEIELDHVTGGTIEQVNGGGNTPNGNANGVPFLNPAGHEPPGWN